MSSWLVSKAQIDVVVTALIALSDGPIPVTEENASEIGDYLWQENCLSIIDEYPHHYGPDGDETQYLPEPGSYVFEPRPVESLIYVFKQNQCYRYQSCEHAGWKSSTSFALTSWLQDKIVRLTGLSTDELREHPEYTNATWGVEVKENGTVWLDANEFWAQYAELQKRQEAS